MKKSSKFISIVLSVLMVLSVVPFTAFASPVKNASTVEALVGNDSLANIVEYLVKGINNKKDDMVGTVLRIVFLAIKDEAKDGYTPLTTFIGEKDVTTLTDEQNAKILIDWVNTNLPGWTAGITEQSWYPTVQNVCKLLGITFDLSSVDSVIKTLYSLCDVASGILLNCGTLNDLNGSSLKNVTVASKGNLGVIKALIQWLNDNIGIIKTAVKGQLELGTIEQFYDPDDGDKGINNIMKELPATVKGYIYKLIDKDTALADSAYKDYTADQLLGVAFKKLITQSDDIVSTTEANDITGKSIYKILTTYIEQVYANFCVEPLNGKFKDTITKWCAEDGNAEIKALFNTDFEFTATTFSSCFAGATSVSGQFNNLLCKILETILTPAAFTAIGLTTGDNTNLNANLTKLCKYVLPRLGTVDGFDFTAFTAEKVETMSLEEMAVQILKIFYKGWFKLDDLTAVNDASSLEALGALAVYYAVANKIPEVGTLDKSALIEANGKLVALTDNQYLEAALTIAVDAGVYELNLNSEKTHFSLDLAAKKASGWGWEELLDEVVDWALNFVSGIPAVSKAYLTQTVRGKLDGYGGFYKLNVILNELIDFSFLNDAGDATFKFDLESFLMDDVLGNILDLDFESLSAIIAPNENATNILGANALIPSFIGVADRIVTALFEHTCTVSNVKTVKKIDCYNQITITSYDAVNGHYITAAEEKVTSHNNQFVSRVEATCSAKGSEVYKCADCGYVTTTELGTINHKWDKGVVVEPTCTEAGYTLYTCTVCGTTKQAKATNALGHNYVETPAGSNTMVCTRCGDTYTKAPSYQLGNIDNDAKISSADARLALRFAVGLDTPSATEKLAADIDNDGKVTSADARLILRAAVGLEKDLSIYHK